MADHGSRQSYADGCRCASCKAAQATYRRDVKARQAGATVTSIGKPGRRPKGAAAPQPVAAVAQDPLSRQIGPNEQAVLDELATLTSAETRKAAAAGAVTLAQIADNPLELGPSRKGAIQEIVKILEDLRKGSARRKGRLASVQAMTKSAAG
jgi:hypothetical protein